MTGIAPAAARLGEALKLSREIVEAIVDSGEVIADDVLVVLNASIGSGFMPHVLFDL
jgi:hypothetical protein